MALPIPFSTDAGQEERSAGNAEVHTRAILCVTTRSMAPRGKANRLMYVGPPMTWERDMSNTRCTERLWSVGQLGLGVPESLACQYELERKGSRQKGYVASS